MIRRALRCREVGISLHAAGHRIGSRRTFGGSAQPGLSSIVAVGVTP